MWTILSRIWTFLTGCFKCCSPIKINCHSTCCEGDLDIQNDINKSETDKRYKVGSLEYSYHHKNK